MEIVANQHYEGLRCEYCSVLISAGQHIFLLPTGKFCHKPCKTRIMKRQETRQQSRDREIF